MAASVPSQPSGAPDVRTLGSNLTPRFTLLERATVSLGNVRDEVVGCSRPLSRNASADVALAASALSPRVARPLEILEGPEGAAEIVWSIPAGFGTWEAEIFRLSREQRAALLVDAAKVVEEALRQGVPAHLIGPGQLFVRARSTGVDLRLVPIAQDESAEDSAAHNLAELGRRVASALYGSGPPRWDVPESISSMLHPLVGCPASETVAQFSAQRFQEALRVSDGSRARPIAAATVAVPASQSLAYQQQRRRLNRRTARDAAIAVLLLLPAFILFAPLMRTQTPDAYANHHESMAGETGTKADDVPSAPSLHSLQAPDTETPSSAGD